jgi:hypothetical protein
LPSHLLTTLHAPRVLHKPILHSQEFDPDNQLFQFIVQDIHLEHKLFSIFSIRLEHRFAAGEIYPNCSK